MPESVPFGSVRGAFSDERSYRDHLFPCLIFNPSVPYSLQGGSRMPESGPFGSVRGAFSDERSYRDHLFPSFLLDFFRLAVFGNKSSPCFVRYIGKRILSTLHFL